MRAIPEPSFELNTLSISRALPAACRAALLQMRWCMRWHPERCSLSRARAQLPALVLAGTVHLLGRSSAGNEVLIEVAEPPDLIIPAAVVTSSPYLMRARVPEPSRLLMIPADVFRRAMLREPVLAQEVIGSLAGQFRRLVRQIKNLKLRSAASASDAISSLVPAARHAAPGDPALREEPHRVGARDDARKLFAQPVGAAGGRRRRPGRDHRDPATRSAWPPPAASTRSSTIRKACYSHPMPHHRHNRGKHDRGNPKDDVTIAFAIQVLDDV